MITVSLPRVDLVHPSYSADHPDLQTPLAVLYEPLLRWQEGRVAPAAVEAWTTADGGSTWDLRLRPGLSFTDGTPCEAQDVLDCLSALTDADGPFGMGGVYADYLSQVSFEAVSRDVFRMYCPTATADYLDLLPAFYVYKPMGAGVQPLGTTSYRLESYEPGVGLEVSAVRPEPDRPDGIAFVGIGSAADRLELVAAGLHDACVAIESLPRQLVEASGVHVHGVPNTLSVTMFLNGFEGVFADAKARVAINHALNIDELITEVWRGHAVPAATVVSPFHYGYPHDRERLSYDPETARRLFDKCDMPDKLRFRAPLVTPDRAPEIVAQVCHQLARIGVEATYELEPDRPKYARDVSQKQIADGAVFDSSPLSTFRILVEKVSSRERGLWWQGVADLHIDALIETARGEHAELARWQAYKACLDALAVRPPWLYLFHPVRVMGKKDPNLGLTLDHSGVLTFTS